MSAFLPLAAALLVAAAPTAFGAPAPAAQVQAGGVGEMELIVVEAPNCAYCNLFRASVLPAYQTLPQTREMPVRFVDASGPEAGGLSLSAPVDVVPTAILMRDGNELGRISGYTGRENFFRSLRHLMASAR